MSVDSQFDVSIVIVTWNVRELVLECLASIQQHASSLKHEVILVDNASGDGTVDAVKARFPAIKVLGLNVNSGFVEANNRAIQIAVGRHILLLNPDTIVCEDSIQQLVEFADRNPEVGLVGPKLIGVDGRVQFVCARSSPTPGAWFFHYVFLPRLAPRSKVFGKLLLTYWDHEDSGSVEAIVGAAMLIPRHTLEQVGLLDASHPMYLEDVDYCARVRQTGLQIHYLAEAKIVHYGGASGANHPLETSVMGLEGLWRFFGKHGTPWDRLLFRMLVLVGALIRTAVFAAWTVKNLSRRRGEGRKRLSACRGAIGWSLGVLRAALPQSRP